MTELTIQTNYMKNLFYLSLIIIVISSCKKYDGDSNYSTYTVQGRLSGGFGNGVWNCTEIRNLNNSNIDDIPRFSCLLDFSKNGQYDIRYTTLSGTLNSENLVYQWKSNKDFIVLNGIDFEIKSLTWKYFIIKSTLTNKEYYFDKWIYLSDLDSVDREDVFYPFPLIE
jgi:hypothetical protein